MKSTLALSIIGLTLRGIANAIGVDEQSEIIPTLVKGIRGLSPRRWGDKNPPPPFRSSSDDENDECEEPKDLDNFPQWREEVGYWIGEYSFYGGDGEPYTSSSWNYPYGQYKGFITGNISGYVPFFIIMNDNLPIYCCYSSVSS